MLGVVLRVSRIYGFSPLEQANHILTANGYAGLDKEKIISLLVLVLILVFFLIKKTLG